MQKNRQLKLMLLTAIVVITVLGSCSSKNENQPQAAGPAAGLPVDALIARTEDVTDSENIIASTASNVEIDIVSEISKKIVAVNFSDGTNVQKGQVLYRLEDSDIRAKQKYAQAELTLAELNEQRMRKLLAEEAVHQQEYDNAKAHLDMAIAQNELLEAELRKTEIRAPFSGTIGISKVKPGAYVSHGQVLVALQDLSIIKLNFSVPEKYINDVVQGRKIIFTTALSDNKYMATIVATEPSVNSNSRSIDVQAVGSSLQGKLKGGMSASVLFERHVGMKGIHIPTEALLPTEDGFSVYTVKDGLANMQKVQIVSRNEKHAVVIEGIAAGDSIIVSNILRATHGTPVNVITAKN